MKFSDVHPGELEVRVILEAGIVFREAGRFDEAEAVFRGISELVPNSEVPQVALGTVELQRGRFAAAQAIYEEALRSFPNSLYARVHRAEALLLQRRRADAEAELDQIIALDPESPHSRTAKALIAVADLLCDNDVSADRQARSKAQGEQS